MPSPVGRSHHGREEEQPDWRDASGHRLAGCGGLSEMPQTGGQGGLMRGADDCAHLSEKTIRIADEIIGLT